MLPFWKIGWIIGLMQHAFKVLRGEHSFESSENELKRLAIKHNENWHKFEE